DRRVALRHAPPGPPRHRRRGRVRHALHRLCPVVVAPPDAADHVPDGAHHRALLHRQGDPDPDTRRRRVSRPGDGHQLDLLEPHPRRRPARRSHGGDLRPPGRARHQRCAGPALRTAALVRDARATHRLRTAMTGSTDHQDDGIRELDATDLPEATRLYVRVFNAPPWNDQWTEATAGTRLRQTLQTPGALGLAIRDADRIIGVAIGYE